ncbi:hypothetical protein [Actinomadura macrotermitis]|uniref:Uncharacterized protein n=1 Tax=Actinomadura macrotermitis TaxID=2585200 RepID=A0A7K0BWZ4_9ACTN|nr:hypothetical protein [Actinomadura macrotermitis]MQY05402.1 hypothetical protein [Actinomadura macrotermitis]
MITTDRTARARLGMMLKELWEASGLRLSQAAELGVRPSTLQGWLCETAPSMEKTETFWSLLRSLQQEARREIHTDSKWDAALRAAQEEAAGGLAQNPQNRFIRLHGPGVNVVAVSDRERERKVMDAFVSGPSSPGGAYLCWYADAPVGKTTLLADYVRRPPAGADILSYFVSPEHGTDTCAMFKKEMADQIKAFLGPDGTGAPEGGRQRKLRFAEAAAESTKHGRKLLLVVDGLDDDAAWSGAIAEGTAHGSIAVLLPVSPPRGMRIIVSLRRRVRLPDDLPFRHPLHKGKGLRELLPREGAPPARRTPLRTDLSGSVMGLLAAAGGGLRAEDLAELTGTSAAEFDRRLEGQAGRSFILDDPILQTYALADTGLVQSVKARLGEEGLARHTRELLDWSRHWCAAGWPDRTPPFPLAHQLRLLTDPTERAAYVLDSARLSRLAAISGPDAALAQLDAFEEEAGLAEECSPGSLALLVRLAAARTVLRGEPLIVPFGAPALLVRLGEVERACGLARSAPTAAAKSMHLADVAVEMAYSGRDEADVVAREAAVWIARASQDYPGIYQDPAPHSRLLGAAHTLVELGRSGAARPLLRAVVGDPAAGVEALTEAAGELTAIRDQEINTALCARAESLSGGGLRARAAAVDLWGALGHFVPSLSQSAGENIEAICNELDPSVGLAAVDLLAVGASALSQLRYKRHKAARTLVQKALARIAAALTAPESLSDDDQAHLSRELAGTLARLTQAIHNSDSTFGASVEVEHLLNSMPDYLRIGLLGDTIPERALVLAKVSVERKGQAARSSAAADKEKDNAYRRWKDSERIALRNGTWPQSVRIKSASPSRRTSGRRPPAGLELSDDPCSDHLRLLREADGHLDVGDLLRSRKTLDEVLRCCPASPAQPLIPRNWTVDLAQALGTAGEFGIAEALVENLSVAPNRTRHLTALSLGCSFGGHMTEGRRYAHEADRLATGSTDPALLGEVARALAWAGERPTMTGHPGNNLQALIAIAAGLVRHHPKEAADIANPLVRKLAERIAPGSPLRIFPELAALLLAYPDIRRPDPRLTEALQDASLHLVRATTSWHAPSMTIAALLRRLGLLSGEENHVVTAMIDRWRHSLHPGQEPRGELAVLFAVDGDTVALDRHVEAAPTLDAQATVLGAAAMYFAGFPVTLSVDSRAENRVVRICLALAHASGGGAPPSETTAQTLVRRLLGTDRWFHIIPLLPRLAPEALTHLGALARDDLRRKHGPTSENGPPLL